MVVAENPETEKIKTIPQQDVKINVMQKALKEPAIKFNLYVEGFMKHGEAKFLQASNKAISTLEQELPGFEYFEFKAVLAASNTN